MRVCWPPYRDAWHTVERGDRAPAWCEDDAAVRTLLRLQRSRHSRLHRAAPPAPFGCAHTVFPHGAAARR
ncbi:hypothetical protein [Streptomyces nigra]|uniref:hypothetical protein n=1 Tax=Streptomyces nigra TaxID=1827580 RepID=UPI0035D91E4E